MKPSTRESLDRYAKSGIPTGSFLRAVLENDLLVAVCGADDQNLADLLEIVRYVHNDTPRLCHGSKERVRDWIEMKAAKRLQGVAT